MINKYFSSILSDFDRATTFLYFFFFGVDSLPQEHKFEEDKEVLEGFAKFYQENIAPKAFLFEQVRLDHLKRFIFRSRLVSIIIIPIWGFFIYVLLNVQAKAVGSDFVMNFLYGVFVISFFILLWPAKVIRKFNLEIKSTLLGEIFRFSGLSYRPQGSQEIDSYNRFGIIPEYDKRFSTTEDLVSGSYKNVSFALEELHLKIEVRARKKRVRVTVFQGVVIILEFNKNFSGRTIVKKETGMIGNFSIKNLSNILRSLEKVSLEDPEFENMFEVYSSDQIEARHLLTTSFMERLKGLEIFFNAQKVEASFYENNLFLIFPTSANLFEVKSIFEEINAAEESKKALEEIAMIYCLIDVLKLSEKS
jgi:uncharacterized protein YbcI